MDIKKRRLFFFIIYFPDSSFCKPKWQKPQISAAGNRYVPAHDMKCAWREFNNCSAIQFYGMRKTFGVWDTISVMHYGENARIVEKTFFSKDIYRPDRPFGYGKARCTVAYHRFSCDILYNPL